MRARDLGGARPGPALAELQRRVPSNSRGLQPQRLGGVRCPPPTPNPPHVSGLVPSLAGASSSSKQSWGEGGGVQIETPPPFVSAAFRHAVVRWDVGGLHYSSPWNIQAGGQRTSLSGLAGCSLTKGPCGPGSCLRTVQGQMCRAGLTQVGAGCLCPLMGVLIWGDVLLSPRALPTRLLDKQAQRSPRWWGPQRTRSRGALAWGARPVWTFGGGGRACLSSCGEPTLRRETWSSGHRCQPRSCKPAGCQRGPWFGSRRSVGTGSLSRKRNTRAHVSRTRDLALPQAVPSEPLGLALGPQNAAVCRSGTPEPLTPVSWRAVLEPWGVSGTWG